MTIRITNWAESNNIINKEQSGFRAHHSTYDKIFELTQISMHAKNMKNYCAAVFMDVEKAFDKVWHDGLIHTLIKLGLPSIYVRYIHSFIQDRYIYIYVEGLESIRIKLNFGVPQGSALSAILFLLYVAEIPTPNTANTHLSQFADDIKQYAHSKGFKTVQTNLQSSINQMTLFCGKRRIAINDSKNFEIIIKPPSAKNKTLTPALLFDNTEIEIKSSGRFLGLVFDDKLNFDEHITTQFQSARTRTMQLSTIHSEKFGPSEKSMLNLFKIFIRSILEYGHIALITTEPNQLKSWEIIQTKFIRFVLKSPKINNEFTLKLANMPSIRDRINHLAYIWFHKTQKNNKDVKEFIDTKINKLSQLKTPYSLINGTYRIRN